MMREQSLPFLPLSLQADPFCFHSYGRDKAKFLEAYLMAPQGIVKLANEIHKQHGLKKPRNSQNGTPAECSAL